MTAGKKTSKTDKGLVMHYDRIFSYFVQFFVNAKETQHTRLRQPNVILCSVCCFDFEYKKNCFRLQRQIVFLWLTHNHICNSNCLCRLIYHQGKNHRKDIIYEAANKYMSNIFPVASYFIIIKCHLRNTARKSLHISPQVLANLTHHSTH